MLRLSLFLSLLATLVIQTSAQSAEAVGVPVNQTRTRKPKPSPTPTPKPTKPVKPSPVPTLSPKPKPPTGESFTQYFDQAAFDKLFPGSHPLYKFQGLVDAAAKYPSFANTGNALNDKRELAAFLAQTAHECDNFKAPEEYAKDTYPESQYCDPSTVPCAKGHRYHGRGPIQLSWNYNYNAAGKAIGIDLLNAPEQVGTNSAIAWQTGLWYWMTPQKAGRVIHDVVAEDDGFAQATDIINGGLECGPGAPNKQNEQQRIANYKKMCAQLGVEPVGKVSCNA